MDFSEPRLYNAPSLHTVNFFDVKKAWVSGLKKAWVLNYLLGSMECIHAFLGPRSLHLRSCLLACQERAAFNILDKVLSLGDRNYWQAGALKVLPQGAVEVPLSARAKSAKAKSAKAKAKPSQRRSGVFSRKLADLRAEAVAYPAPPGSGEEWAESVKELSGPALLKVIDRLVGEDATRSDLFNEQVRGMAGCKRKSTGLPQWWAKHQDLQAKVMWFKSHSLRVSRCTHLLQHGVDAAIIRRHISFHQKEDTFMAYVGRMASERVSWDHCFFQHASCSPRSSSPMVC